MKKRNKNVTIVKTAIIAGTLAVTAPQAAFAETSANTTTDKNVVSTADPEEELTDEEKAAILAEKKETLNDAEAKKDALEKEYKEKKTGCYRRKQSS